jgi:hypothetical protein
MTENMLKYKQTVLPYHFAFLEKPDTKSMYFKNIIINHMHK